MIYLVFAVFSRNRILLSRLVKVVGAKVTGADVGSSENNDDKESELTRETKDANEKLSTTGMAVIYGTSLSILFVYVILNYSLATGADALSALTGSANLTETTITVVVNATSNM